MLMVAVLLPVKFDAHTVKLNLPSVVGVPEMVPELKLKFSPGGRLPF